jgi:hypothetical protein
MKKVDPMEKFLTKNQELKRENIRAMISNGFTLIDMRKLQNNSAIEIQRDDNP